MSRVYEFSLDTNELVEMYNVAFAHEASKELLARF